MKNHFQLVVYSGILLVFIFCFGILIYSVIIDSNVESIEKPVIIGVEIERCRKANGELFVFKRSIDNMYVIKCDIPEQEIFRFEIPFDNYSE